MELIKQKGQYDCALACLSMVSGKLYDELFDMDFRNRIELAKTCSDNDLQEAFKLAGFIYDYDTHTVYTSNHSPHVIRNLLWRRPAIIQAPSLNYDKAEHFIAWDGENLLDPSNKQVYQFWQCLRPTYVVLFNRQIGA